MGVQRTLLAWLVPALAAAPAFAAAPSTFGPVIGNAVLCLSETDNKYFYSYLATSFGKAYKHEGGAFWFKTDGATLWGAPVLEVIVSDDTSPLTFIAAVADATPEKLEPMVTSVSGLHFHPTDATRYPVREALAGSRIVYFDRRAKIYCSKYKPLPPPDAR
jgi:hypothetical protein